MTLTHAHRWPGTRILAAVLVAVALVAAALVVDAPRTAAGTGGRTASW